MPVRSTIIIVAATLTLAGCLDSAASACARACALGGHSMRSVTTDECVCEAAPIVDAGADVAEVER